jgi:hypothetical protein
VNGELVAVWVAAGVVGYGAAFLLAPDPTGLVPLAVGAVVTVALAAVGQRLSGE